MLEILNESFFSFTTFAKSNPVVSGIVSLWGLGVVTFLFKEIPNKLSEIVIKQFSVRVVINCRDEAFSNLMKWYQDTGNSKKARTLRLTNGSSANKEILSAGYGNHYFWFNGLPFKLRRTKDEKMNFGIRENLEIVTLGRSQKPLRKLLQESNPFSDSSKMTKVYKWEEGYWAFSHDQLVRPLESITLEENLKRNLIEYLNVFKNDKNWYENHGIPYRTGICLFGPPGTGKTSLVRSICGLDSRDLYTLNLNVITDQGLEAAIDSIDENAVVLIEDIDSFKATNQREEETNDKDSTKDTSHSSLTLSGVLNAIDGISGSKGRILIITTNNIDSIDSALLRPGRVDLKLELGYLTQQTALQAFNRFFPEFKLPDFRIKEKLTPAEFQNMVMQYKNDPEKVLELISLRKPIELGVKVNHNNETLSDSTSSELEGLDDLFDEIAVDMGHS